VASQVAREKNTLLRVTL